MSVKKGLLGILSIWPLIYMVGFVGFMLMGPVWMGGRHASPPVGFEVVFAVHGLTMLEIVGLTLYYAVDALRDQSMEQTQRMLWALILFVGNALALPIYWSMVIQPRNTWSSITDAS